MSDNDRQQAPGRFLRMPEVKAMVGRSPRQIYRMIKEGEFPRQRRQSHKVAVWYENEILAWQNEQVLKDSLA